MVERVEKICNMVKDINNGKRRDVRTYDDVSVFPRKNGTLTTANANGGKSVPGFNGFERTWRIAVSRCFFPI
jgi:hypothetical protein